MNEYQLEQKVLKVVGDIFFSIGVDNNKFIDATGGYIGENRPRTNDDNMAMLRLDYEWVGHPDTLDAERVRAEMLYHLTRDLTDLFWNGDTDSTDPLLKQINGFKKNPDREDPVIRNVKLFRQWSPKKETVEFTLFFLVNK